MFKNIGKLSSIQKLVQKVTTTSRLVYNHGHWFVWLRKKEELREIVRLVETKFATNFIALHSFLQYKEDL